MQNAGDTDVESHVRVRRERGANSMTLWADPVRFDIMGFGKLLGAVCFMRRRVHWYAEHKSL
jgi:hypothetical protein